MFATEFSEL